MTRITRTLLTSMVLFSLLLASCGEDGTDTPTPTTVDSTTFPTPDDAFGILVAIKTFTEISSPIGPSSIEFGTAVAAFINGTEFFAAGDVTCNTEELKLNANNSYVHIPGLTDIDGIDFAGSANTATWSVEGSADVPAISESYAGFPSEPVVTSGTTVNTADGYTLNWTGGSGSGTDSLIVSVFGSNDGASKTVVAGTTSVTFSSAELSDVGATENGILQVAAYKIKKEDVDGKNIYLINESVGSETGVSIQ